MTATTPRPRGRPRRFSDKTLLPGFWVSSSLAAWFKALPGASSRERLAWLRERTAQMQTERAQARNEFYAQEDTP
jgi:hypothetical protein